MILLEQFASLYLFILGRLLRKFILTAEGTFILYSRGQHDLIQEYSFHTLVSSGLDCLGVSLAEVCATCLRCHLW